MIDNIYDTTLEILKEEIKISRGTGDSAYYMMKHLVELLGEHEWNDWIQAYMESTIENCKKNKVAEELWFGCFFYDFHKSIRQTDVYNLEISKDLGWLKEDEVTYWKVYADKHSYTLKGRVVGKDEYQRTIYTLYYRHAGGHLDSILYELININLDVQFIMHIIWDMHTKEYKNFKDYFWSNDYLDMQKVRKSYSEKV